MMKIPQLADLLQEPTMFIMGAGSTKDYGFPLWEDLKKIYFGLASSELLGVPGAEFWQKALSEESDKTVDTLAASAPSDALYLFQRMTIDTFLRFEEKDLGKNSLGWIEAFSEKYFDLIGENNRNQLVAQKYLKNLHFCTLNYERCFAYRFGKTIVPSIDRIFDNHVMADFILKNALINYETIYQPHGCIGKLASDGVSQFLNIEYRHHYNPGSSQREYGNSTRISYSTGLLDSVLPADLLRYGSGNQAYSQMQRELDNCKNVVFIGLSKQGYEQSLIKIDSSHKSYCTGSEQLFPECTVLDVYAEAFVEGL